MRVSRIPELIVITQQQWQEMARYCEGEADILGLYLYGSLGTAYQTPLSDVDLAVLPVAGPSWTWDRQVDVSIELSGIARSDDVNLINLRSVPVILQMRVLETGRPRYIRDRVALADFVAGVIIRHADFSPDLEAFYRDWDTAIREEYL
jgi:predicted nucleotidyltransferase